MPALATRPEITPATYSDAVADPTTVSPGKVRRAKRILGRAKALIEDKGWIQNQSVGPNGERCLTAAIDKARAVKSKSGLLPLTSPKFDPILAGLLETARAKVTRRAPHFTYIGSVIDWNDKSGRTKEQALALLSNAAE